MQEVGASTKEYLRGDYKELEVSFVDGLFKMYKLRKLIAKTKEEILSDGLISSYKHRFRTNLFPSNITCRPSTIEKLVMDKILELDRQKKV